MISAVMEDNLVRWLLSGNPWVVYGTLRDLLGRDAADTDVVAAREAISKHRLIKDVFTRQNSQGYWGRPSDIHTWWPRKDTSFWVMGVLADFGLTVEDIRLARAAGYILGLQLPSGGFLGFEPQKAADCHTAILLDPLVQMGFGGDPCTKRAYGWLLKRQRSDGGWWCKDSGQPGGPREKEPSCPFATMFVLGALARHPEFKESHASERAVGFLLSCWSNRGKIKYPGHDSQIGPGWQKLKYPFTDYRILKFLDVLSRFSTARADSRISEMLKLLAAKMDERGRLRPESVVKVWADFDFGQKKEPSRWVTMLVWKVMRRFGK